MRNRPLIGWDATPFDEPDGENALPDESPALRVGLLLAGVLLPLLLVAGRLIQLQGTRAGAYVTAWEVTTTHDERIPCRDGRILSADGQVLAEDRLRFDVLVHYRWLEEPPDAGWLKQRAYNRLTRRDRRDVEKVAQATEAVLQERRRLWELLATTTGRAQADLHQTRLAIQSRVERIVESVTRRRHELLTATAAASDARPAPERFRALDAIPRDLADLRTVIVTELTTAPRRGESEPIVVTEELAHHPLIEDVDLRVVAAIESAPSLFPGVQIQTTSERVYPARAMAAHLIGVRTEVTAEDVESRHGTAENDGPRADALQPGDRIGRTGIERAFDQTLRGRPGQRRLVKDRRGEILSQSVIQPPVHGRDVVLTIDAQLQSAAERLLDESISPTQAADPHRGNPPTGPLARPPRGPSGGCLVVLDVRTGEVITAAAAPRFDLGLMIHPDPDDWQSALSDLRRPFFPRVTQMTIPPGSVFKILTAVALLESRLIDPDAPVFCQGYLNRPDRNRCYIYRHYGIGHGDMTLSDALCQSCNVYFFHAARSLGAQTIADWAARFGLGRPTGGEVPGERGGHLPQADDSGQIVDEEWYNGSTLQLAIGQSSLTVTPLQVARMVAAVANDGFLVTPRFVSHDAADAEPSTFGEIQLVGHVTAEDASPKVEKIAGLSPGTLARVREGMRLVVDHRQGTGKRVRRDDVAIAGKTGTAEVGGRQGDHAWFVGFVPADAPRYAFVVVLEHGGSGGSVAGPVARKFIEEMLETGLLPTRPSSPPDNR